MSGDRLAAPRVTGSRRRVWLVVDHPNQLANALPVAAVAREHGIETVLLISPHRYWENVPAGEVEPYVDRIHIFSERPDYPASLRSVIETDRRVRRVRREIRRLGIGDDTVVGFSGPPFVENAVISSVERSQRVLCLFRERYDELTTPVDHRHYRLDRGGRYARRLVEPLHGLEPTLWLVRQPPQPTWLGRVQWRYERDVWEIYARVLVLLNLHESEPTAPAENVAFAPLPPALDTPAPGEDAQDVVFFGDTARGTFLPEEEFRDCLQRSVDYVRRWYPGRRLVYRPHPLEPLEESALLRLDGFETETDRLPAELYLAKRKAHIEAVYSLCSTSSRTAANLGIDAYATFASFAFGAAEVQGLEQMYGDQPRAFFVDDLDAAPAGYQRGMRSAEQGARFKSAVTWALNARSSASDPVAGALSGGSA